MRFSSFLNFKSKLYKSQNQENQRWGVKSASRGYCEWHVGKVLRFFPQYVQEFGLRFKRISSAELDRLEHAACATGRDHAGDTVSFLNAHCSDYNSMALSPFKQFCITFIIQKFQKKSRINQKVLKYDPGKKIQKGLQHMRKIPLQKVICLVVPVRGARSLVEQDPYRIPRHKPR